MSYKELEEGFRYFLDFDIKAYVVEHGQMPPIAELRKNLRDRNLLYKEDESKRTQLNTFFNLMIDLMYKLDDNLMLQSHAQENQESFVKYLKNESSFMDMVPFAITFGVTIGTFIGSK